MKSGLFTFVFLILSLITLSQNYGGFCRFTDLPEHIELQRKAERDSVIWSEDENNTFTIPRQ